MISAVELKKYMANNYIFYIIIYKFHYRQKLCLVILLPIDKLFELSFHYIILSLGLAICLKMKNGKELLLNVKKVV